jgi:hypothetical protein
LWGAAIDVPLSVVAPPPNLAEVMLTPGANQSTQLPQFDHEARVSVLLVAPIVSAAGVRAGENRQASLPLLPAATE